MKNANLFLLLLSILLLGSCTANKLEELETSGYSTQPQEVNYSIVALKNSSIQVKGDTILNAVGYRELVAQFNEEHRQDFPKLQISTLAIVPTEGQATPMMTIRRFDAFGKAEAYAAKLEKYLAKAAKGQASVYPITQDNYRNLIRRRDIGEFEKFYKLSTD